MAARHWTDEDLLAHLYGVGPEDDHLEQCRGCAERLNAMRAMRRAHEAGYTAEDEVSFEFLASQRRQIYRRISEPPPKLIRRLAPAFAASLVVAGSLVLMQMQERHENAVHVKAFDTQLVEDVGSIATNPEPAPTAPLQALFED